MGTLYIDSGGSATNSGSRDDNTAHKSGAAATVSGTVISLDGSPDLSAVVFAAGPTQDSIYLAQATNSNRKIFWITAVDNVAKTVTVDVAPTGVTSSSWAIGGRCVLTNASQEGAVRAGDVVQFNNSPAAAAATRWTVRNSGSSAAGYVTIRGKTGVRPKLTTTNTSIVINCNTLNFIRIENLELEQQGATGNVLVGGTVGMIVKNVKISDGGGHGIVGSSGGYDHVEGCEISGVGGDGINTGTGRYSAHYNYIHDITGNGIYDTGSNAHSFVGNIIDSCGGRGFYFNGAVSLDSPVVIGNTVYGCGNSGIEITDIDYSLFFFNNILKDNGNAAGEYNFEQTSGDASYTGIFGNNIFNISGGLGGGNVSGYTLDSTDLTSDPLFVDAPNGDFRLQAGSPAKASGYPGAFLGGPTGYLDRGAVQRQEAGGILVNPGMSGGCNA